MKNKHPIKLSNIRHEYDYMRYRTSPRSGGFESINDLISKHNYQMIKSQVQDV